jgi:hypothetical protein
VNHVPILDAFKIFDVVSHFSIWCSIKSPKSAMKLESNEMTDRQTISFIEISIEAGILLGGMHEAGGGRN